MSVFSNRIGAIVPITAGSSVEADERFPSTQVVLAKRRHLQAVSRSPGVTMNVASGIPVGTICPGENYKVMLSGIAC